MPSILEIFTEKILQNLVYTEGISDDGKQLIDFTLDTFDAFVSTPSSSRMLIKSPLVQQLVSNHITQFPLLQSDPNPKHLA